MYDLSDEGEKLLETLPDDVVADIYEALQGFITIDDFWQRFAEHYGYENYCELRDNNGDIMVDDLTLVDISVLISVLFAKGGNYLGSNELE